MRTHTSFAILSILAAAGSSLGAPIQAPKDVTNVVQKMTHGHRRGDSLVIDFEKDFPKHKNMLEVHAEAEHEHHPRAIVDAKHPENSGLLAHPIEDAGKGIKSVFVEAKPVAEDVVESVKSEKGTVPSILSGPRRDRRNVVDVFPPTNPGPHAGLVDVDTHSGDAHLIQTPGKDKTLVDVKAGVAETKVNLPVGSPVQDEIKDVHHGVDDAFHGGGKNLAGKIKNEGVEVKLGAEDQEHHSSSASASKSASASHSASSSHSASHSASSAHPTSSAHHSSASASASASKSASHSSASHSSAPHSSASHSSASHSSASASKSSSSAHPTQSAGGDDSGFQVLPGVFQAAKDKGKISLDPILKSEDPHDANPNKDHGGLIVDPGRKAVGSTLGQNPKDGKDHTTPARIEFGHLPKQTVPCDGINVRDNGELVDICIEAALVDKRPKGYDVCPDYLNHDIHAHADSKTVDTLDPKLSKEVGRYVKLCVGAGIV